MKSFAAWLLIVCLALSLCACAAEEPAVVTEAPVTEPVTVPVEESVELVTEEVIEGQLTIGAETNYYVTVMDQDGAPVPGVAVRLDNNKSIPCDTNELGVATFVMPLGQYAAIIDQLPFGYEFADESREFTFELDTTYLTIVVNSAEADTEQLDIGWDEVPDEDFGEEIPEG